MLCGYPVLADARDYDTFEQWLAATREMSFEKAADDLVKALETATDREALEVLVELSTAFAPPEEKRDARG